MRLLPNHCCFDGRRSLVGVLAGRNCRVELHLAVFRCRSRAVSDLVGPDRVVLPASAAQWPALHGMIGRAFAPGSSAIIDRNPKTQSATTTQTERLTAPRTRSRPNSARTQIRSSVLGALTCLEMARSLLPLEIASHLERCEYPNRNCPSHCSPEMTVADSEG